MGWYTTMKAFYSNQLASELGSPVKLCLVFSLLCFPVSLFKLLLPVVQLQSVSDFSLTSHPTFSTLPVFLLTSLCPLRSFFFSLPSFPFKSSFLPPWQHSWISHPLSLDTLRFPVLVDATPRVPVSSSDLVWMRDGGVGGLSLHI